MTQFIASTYPLNLRNKDEGAPTPKFSGPPFSCRLLRIIKGARAKHGYPIQHSSNVDGSISVSFQLPYTIDVIGPVAALRGHDLVMASLVYPLEQAINPYALPLAALNALRLCLACVH